VLCLPRNSEDFRRESTPRPASGKDYEDFSIYREKPIVPRPTSPIDILFCENFEAFT
jgi:hypothetical protein